MRSDCLLQQEEIYFHKKDMHTSRYIRSSYIQVGGINKLKITPSIHRSRLINCSYATLLSHYLARYYSSDGNDKTGVGDGGRLTWLLVAIRSVRRRCSVMVGAFAIELGALAGRQ